MSGFTTEFWFPLITVQTGGGVLWVPTPTCLNLMHEQCVSEYQDNTIRGSNKFGSINGLRNTKIPSIQEITSDPGINGIWSPSGVPVINRTTSNIGYRDGGVNAPQVCCIQSTSSTLHSVLCDLINIWNAIFNSAHNHQSTISLVGFTLLH